MFGDDVTGLDNGLLAAASLQDWTVVVLDHGGVVVVGFQAELVGVDGLDGVEGGEEAAAVPHGLALAA